MSKITQELSHFWLNFSRIKKIASQKLCSCNHILPEASSRCYIRKNIYIEEGKESFYFPPNPCYTLIALWKNPFCLALFLARKYRSWMLENWTAVFCRSRKMHYCWVGCFIRDFCRGWISLSKIHRKASGQDSKKWELLTWNLFSLLFFAPFLSPFSYLAGYFNVALYSHNNFYPSTILTTLNSIERTCLIFFFFVEIRKGRRFSPKYTFSWIKKEQWSWVPRRR